MTNPQNNPTRDSSLREKISRVLTHWRRKEYNEVYYPLDEIMELITQDRQQILEAVIEALPEKQDESWLNKDLVDTDLKWAKKAIPEAYKRGKNEIIDQVKTAIEAMKGENRGH